MVAPFIGLTGGASLLDQLVHTNPIAMVAAVFVLWGIVMLPLGTWTTCGASTGPAQPACPGPRRRLAAAGLARARPSSR